MYHTIVRWAALIAAACTVGCADLEPREVTSNCCDCLVRNACTDWSEEHCKQWANGSRQDVLSVDSECSDHNSCTKLCADEGAVWVK